MEEIFEKVSLLILLAHFTGFNLRYFFLREDIPLDDGVLYHFYACGDLRTGVGYFFWRHMYAERLWISI